MTTELLDDVVETVLADGQVRSSLRRIVGVIGQYALLCVLSVVVLAPLFMTLIQALSPPLAYIDAGKPLHPVEVAWKDRTWFTGGAWSVLLRTAVILAAFAWLQRVGSPHGSWLRHAREIATVRRLVAIVGGTVTLTVLLGPVFGSLHAADGRTAGLFFLAVAGVAVTQTIGFHEPGHRSVPVAILDALAVSVVAVAAAMVFVGATVWTQSWASSGLGEAMLRSLTMSVLITVAQVVTAILAAYAFVFLDFPFKRILFAAALATLLLPLEVTLVGNIALIRQLGWIDSMQGLVLPFAASAMGIFLIRQGFRGIPKDIQDAVRIDGHGHLTFLTRFAIPLNRPVIASFTVISALAAWNQYLWPRSIIETDASNTLQIALRSNISENIAQANVTVAAALVSAVPVAVMLVAFQRHIIRGLTAGAVK
ncbi:MAG: carbohydrate ABC transporter permease [Acidimicrobiales bacterium]|nr:carbohydrate ABC transporter permease [Acidimicrobiales bacterium]